MFNEPNLSGGILNTIFALVFAVTIVALIWGVAMYFTDFGSDHGKAESKSMILRSITWLFLLMCAYALVSWVRGAVGF